MDTCVLGVGIWLVEHSFGPAVGPSTIFFVVCVIADHWPGSKISQHNQHPTIGTKYQERSFRLISWRTLAYIILMPIGQFLWFVFLFGFLFGLDFRLRQGFFETVLVFGVPSGILLLLLARDKLNSIIATSIMILFWSIIIDQLRSMGRPIDAPLGVGFPTMTSIGIILVLPPILLSIAPAKALSRRLIFLALGLLLLIALNELSKLGLDVTAPKQG